LFDCERKKSERRKLGMVEVLKCMSWVLKRDMERRKRIKNPMWGVKLMN